ncbi:hypothetical protein ANCDUO_10500, partial [Ancylostoma duodenale]
MGLNSFLEASTAGLPIVAIPLFADKTHNAHSGAYQGTTVIVKPEQLTTTNIKRALEKILYDPRLMKQLGAYIRSRLFMYSMCKSPLRDDET